jgi:hypothetical protein
MPRVLVLEAGVEMPRFTMSWQHQDDRTYVMQLAERGLDWIEVRRSSSDARSSWRVDACLNGAHCRVAEGFPTVESAQGNALLLAMRHVPAHRDALHAQLDALPGAWWWRISPSGDAAAEPGSIFSSRVMASAEAAERSGRAAGRGWWLYVYGPGCVRAFGQLPR